MTADAQGFATIPRSMLHDGSVPRDAKLVYLILSSHVGGSGMAWPSHRRMADLLGMHLSTVKRQLAWLRDNGYIQWEQRRRDDDALTTNTYVILAGEARSPAKELGSERSQGGSVRAGVGAEGATPRRSGSGGMAHTERVNESQQNERTTKTSSPGKPGAVFDEFWSVYPRHVGKQGAEKVWKAQLAKGVDPVVIIDGAARYRDDRNRDPEFTCHPSTWLNRGSWDDDPLPARIRPANARTGPVNRPAWEA